MEKLFPAGAMILAHVVAFAGVLVLGRDHLLGTRLLGLGFALAGCQVAWTRELGYGIRGRPVSGYITGNGAIAIGLATALVGLLFAMAPSHALMLQSTPVIDLFSSILRR